MENSNAMTSVKSNLTQSTNFNTHYAFVGLMNLRIISKYSYMKGIDLMIKEAFQSRTIDQKKEEDSLGGLNERLKYLGLIPDGSDVRSHNEGNSNYNDGTHIITPWSIWLDYPELTSWDDDIIKRVLRTKADAGYTPEEQRILDYKKIIHNCQERIRQLKYYIK